MKVNFSSLSFGANLLINNLGKARGFSNRTTQTLKENFKIMTPDKDNILILTTLEKSDEDKFELFDESGEKIAKYSTPLSKYLKNTPIEKISKRLADIYEIMKIKASFNFVINTLKEYRAKIMEELRQIEENDSLDEQMRNNLIEIKKSVIKGANKLIEYNARASIIECDSYELLHGMKDEFD